MTRRIALRLRTRLLLLTLFAFVPAILLAIYVLVEGGRLVESRQKNEALASTRLLAEQQHARLQSSVALLQVLAEARSILDADAAGCEENFARVAEGNAQHNAFALIAADGRAICTWPAYSGTFLEREWFGAALDSDAPVLGSYQENYVDGRPSVVMAKAIRLAGGASGVLAAALDLEHLLQLERLHVGSDTSVALIDPNGTILARRPDHANWAGEKVSSTERFVRLMRDGEGVLEFVGVDGIRRYYGYSRVDLGRTTAMLAAVAAPVRSGVAQLLGANLLLLLGLAAGAMAAVWYGGKRLVTTPIERLTRTALELKAGNASSRAPSPEGTDEIATLGRAINDMAESREVAEAETSAALARESDARQQLQRAQEVGKLGSWEVDLERNVLRWSDTVLPIFEIERADFGGTEEAFFDLIHSDDREQFLRARARWLEQGGPFFFEHRIVTPSGKHKWVIERGEIVSDDAGELRFTVGTVQDITDLKEAELSRQRAERELERQQALVRMAGQIGRVGGWRYEIGADNLEWTEETARIHDEPPGTSPNLDRGISYYAPADRNRIRHLFSRCLETGAKYDGVFRLITATGREISVRAIGEPEYDADGNIVAVRGAFQDITELVEAEERLHEAQKLESIGQLTGGMAHDFNNLLTVILGNAELLSEELDDGSNLRAMAGSIRSAAERGGELTHRLLAFARRQRLEPNPADVNLLIGGMDNLVRRTLGAQVELEIVRAGGLWHAMIDEAQLESALLNLCINARDAMPDGGRLTIETANAHLDATYAAQNAEVTPGQYVMIAVSDTGQGMGEETLARAFEPFFTTKEVGKGSGLGLSQVYGFIKQSAGHVRIYSEPGHGTTVKLYLPRAAEDAAPQPREAEEAPVQTGTERILLVEDDDLVREYVTAQVAALGYRVTAARNGAEALALLHERPPFDLLFTDVILPGGMTGKELADAAHELVPDLPVLFTSGYSENAVIHHGRLDPDTQLLQKPYSRQELATRIRSALDGGRRTSDRRP